MFTIMDTYITSFVLLFGMVYHGYVGAAPRNSLLSAPSIQCTSSASRILPDPSDCHKFIRCLDGKPISFSCPPRTAFDPKSQVCAWGIGENGCGENANDAQGIHSRLYNNRFTEPATQRTSSYKARIETEIKSGKQNYDRLDQSTESVPSEKAEETTTSYNYRDTDTIQSENVALATKRPLSGMSDSDISTFSTVNNEIKPTKITTQENQMSSDNPRKLNMPRSTATAGSNNEVDVDPLEFSNGQIGDFPSNESEKESETQHEEYLEINDTINTTHLENNDESQSRSKHETLNSLELQAQTTQESSDKIVADISIPNPSNINKEIRQTNFTSANDSNHINEKTPHSGETYLRELSETFNNGNNDNLVKTTTPFPVAAETTPSNFTPSIEQTPASSVLLKSENDTESKETSNKNTMQSDTDNVYISKSNVDNFRVRLRLPQFNMQPQNRDGKKIINQVNYTNIDILNGKVGQVRFIDALKYGFGEKIHGTPARTFRYGRETNNQDNQHDSSDKKSSSSRPTDKQSINKVTTLHQSAVKSTAIPNPVSDDVREMSMPTALSQPETRDYDEDLDVSLRLPTNLEDGSAIQISPYMARDIGRRFKCPRPTGYYQDPGNCGVFYQCDRGVPYKRNCPQGQVFHPDVVSCVASNLVPSCLKTSKYSQPNPKKGFNCPHANGLFKDKMSCRHYFECNDWSPIRRKCMLGSVYDAERSKCSYSAIVPGCEHDSKGEGYNLNVVMTASQESFRCPKDGYFRDPLACGAFYLCAQGEAVRHSCQPGTSFDVDLNMCVWSSLVRGCEDYDDEINDLPSSSRKVKNATVEGQSDEGYHYVNAGTDEASDAIVYEREFEQHDFVCPSEDGIFPDERNCSLYYVCNRHSALRMRCPTGYGYDVTTGFCVNVIYIPQCVKETPFEIISEHKQHLQADSQDRPFQCPREHGLYAHPYNCSVFIHCFEGKPYRHDCQIGTVYSKETASCTWPHLVPECHEVKQHDESDEQNQQQPQRINSKTIIPSNKDIHDLNSVAKIKKKGNRRQIYQTSDGEINNQAVVSSIKDTNRGSNDGVNEKNMDIKNSARLNKEVGGHTTPSYNANDNIQVAYNDYGNSYYDDDGNHGYIIENYSNIDEEVAKAESKIQANSNVDYGRWIEIKDNDRNDQYSYNTNNKDDDRNDQYSYNTNNKDDDRNDQYSYNTNNKDDDRNDQYSYNTNNKDDDRNDQYSYNTNNKNDDRNDQYSYNTNNKDDERNNQYSYNTNNKDNDGGHRSEDFSDNTHTNYDGSVGNSDNAKVKNKNSQHRYAVVEDTKNRKSQYSSNSYNNKKKGTGIGHKIEDAKPKTQTNNGDIVDIRDSPKVNDNSNDYQRYGVVKDTSGHYSQLNNNNYNINNNNNDIDNKNNGNNFNHGYVVENYVNYDSTALDSRNKYTSNKKDENNDVENDYIDVNYVDNVEAYNGRYTSHGLGVEIQDFRCPALVDGYYRDHYFCDIFHRCAFGTKFTFFCPSGTFFRLELNICDFWDTVADCSKDGLRLDALETLPQHVTPLQSNPKSYEVSGNQHESSSLSAGSKEPVPSGTPAHSDNQINKQIKTATPYNAKRVGQVNTASPYNSYTKESQIETVIYYEPQGDTKENQDAMVTESTRRSPYPSSPLPMEVQTENAMQYQLIE